MITLGSSSSLSIVMVVVLRSLSSKSRSFQCWGWFFEVWKMLGPHYSPSEFIQIFVETKEIWMFASAPKLFYIELCLQGISRCGFQTYQDAANDKKGCWSIGWQRDLLGVDHVILPQSRTVLMYFQNLSKSLLLCPLLCPIFAVPYRRKFSPISLVIELINHDITMWFSVFHVQNLGSFFSGIMISPVRWSSLPFPQIKFITDDDH